MDVDKMTDAELRMKLIEYGFPVMPITSTTKKTMVKKLKVLMENKSKINADNRRSLAKYSSGEEDSSDAESTKAKKNRRQTMAAPLQSTTTSTSKKTVVKKVEMPVDVRRQTRGGRMVQMVESDDQSDSDRDVVEMKDLVAERNRLKKEKETPKYEPFVSYRTSTPTGGYSSYSGGSGDANERLQQIRSRLSLGSGPSSSYLSSPTNYFDKTDLNAVSDGNDSPFLSNFTRKLSRSSTVPSASGDFKNDAVKEHDTNGASTYTRYISRAPKYNTYGQNYNVAAPETTSNSRSNLVSFAVIALALLFFIVVTVLYLGLHNGNTAIDTTGLHIPFCVSDDASSKRLENCIIDVDVKPAVDIYRVVNPELIRRSIDKFCYSGDLGRFISEDGVVEHIEKYGSGEYTTSELRQHVRAFAILALVNPKWDISLTLSPNDSPDPLAAITDALPAPKPGFHQQSSSNDKKVHFYAGEPELPFLCRWRMRLGAAFRSLLVVLGVGAMAYMVRKYYIKHQLATRRHRDEVYLMVERIVEILQSASEAAASASPTAADPPQDYLVINHVRDMLLPITDRQRLERTWSDAVRFLGENESRVRTEVQVVRGEQYEVWRWVGNANTSGASPRNKSWQGQAFETQAGSVNSLPCSPTPCLKVRGMLNNNGTGAATTITNNSSSASNAAGDDPSSVSVREAVLAKCAHRCQLLHCAVDAATSAIYLRCATQADAAVAYRALHGWWYAGHLVTVKYLRLERYMQRFPDAPATGPPFLRALHPAADWSN